MFNPPKASNGKTEPAVPASSRRDWLASFGGGFGALALSALSHSEAAFAQDLNGTLTSLHHPPKAKRVIQLFMAGAASHIDLFDYKPRLIAEHGKPSDFGESVEAFQNGLGPWLQPIWPFKPYGNCGKMLSDVVADLGSVADEIAFNTTWSANPAFTVKRHCCRPRVSIDPDFRQQALGLVMLWEVSTRTCRHLSFCQIIVAWPRTERRTGIAAFFHHVMRALSFTLTGRSQLRICFPASMVNLSPVPATLPCKPSCSSGTKRTRTTATTRDSKRAFAVMNLQPKCS